MENVDKNTYLDINLNSVCKNYNIIKKKVGEKCIVAATVKANAYGLGVDKIVPALLKVNCKFFFVATTNEAIQLRKINKKISIFILNGLITSDIKILKKYNLIPVINNLEQLKKIERFQKGKKYNFNIALHFDTGMSRLGFDQVETRKLIRNKKDLIKHSNVILVMSHLACADDKKSKLNKKQLLKFNDIKAHFPESLKSISNSAGILLGNNYHFDMVRPGISLFGGHCQKNERKIYRQVVSLRSRPIQVREIYPGDTVGYGATYIAKKTMKIATFGLGYADGFDRLFSNNYFIYFKKKKLRIVGRVSMDLITIDLSNIKNTKSLINREFEIIGSKYTINNIAKTINTIPYEILTNLGKRYQRRYISY